MMRIAIRLIAIYLDFLVFSTILGLAAYVLGDMLTTSGVAGIGIPRWITITGISLVLALLARASGASVGDWILVRLHQLAEASELPKRGWINLIIGTFLFLEATKHLVRWTQMYRPMPVMGIIPEGNMQVLVDISGGIASLIAAVLLLRLTAIGVRLTVLLAALGTISIAVSWSQFPEAIERMVLARREFQGLPVREGEVATMQALLPAFMLVTSAAVLLLVMFAYVWRQPRPT